VPSVSEAAGIPDYAVDSWQAIFAPQSLQEFIVKDRRQLAGIVDRIKK